MNVARRCAPTFALSAVCVAASAGCGAAADGSGRSGEARQADTVAPLYFTQSKTDIRAETYYASAVDETGTAFVLYRLGGPDQDNDTVAAFDANGTATGVFRASATSGEDLTSIRAGAGTVAVEGTKYPGIHSARNPQHEVRAFDPNGVTRFEYLGAIGTHPAGVEICSDGSIVTGEVSGSGAALVDVDASGNVVWTVPTGVTPQKIRCLGSGRVVVAGVTGGAAYAAQYEGDGSIDWSWTGQDSGVGNVTFDVDSSANVHLGATRTDAAGTHDVAYEVDSSGALQWSWASDGPNDSVAGVAAYDGGTTTVTGWRGLPGSRHFYTAQIDPSGNLLWAHDDAVGGPSADAQAVGVAMDAAGNAFVCGQANGATAVLYAPDGTTTWTYSTPSLQPGKVDVTNGVARCIGGTTTGGLGILAFSVQ